MVQRIYFVKMTHMPMSLHLHSELGISSHKRTIPAWNEVDDIVIHNLKGGSHVEIYVTIYKSLLESVKRLWPHRNRFW